MTLKLLESMQLEKFIKAELWWRQLAASHLSALPSSTVWLIIGESWVCHGSKKLEIFWEFRRLFFWQIKQHFLIAFASLGTTAGWRPTPSVCLAKNEHQVLLFCFTIAAIVFWLLFTRVFISSISSILLCSFHFQGKLETTLANFSVTRSGYFWNVLAK